MTQELRDRDTWDEWEAKVEKMARKACEYCRSGNTANMGNCEKCGAPLPADYAPGIFYRSHNVSTAHPAMVASEMQGQVPWGELELQGSGEYWRESDAIKRDYEKQCTKAKKEYNSFLRRMFWSAR